VSAEAKRLRAAMSLPQPPRGEEARKKVARARIHAEMFPEWLRAKEGKALEDAIDVHLSHMAATRRTFADGAGGRLRLVKIEQGEGAPLYKLKPVEKKPRRRS
jgi:methionine synthase II (cobalamin-independent)